VAQNYLRRGADIITVGGTSTTIVRHSNYVENDELCSMKTASLNSVEFPVTVVNTNNATQTCILLLTFNSVNQCTVSTTTSGFSASGTGVFVEKGDKKSWGNKDRDVSTWIIPSDGWEDLSKPRIPCCSRPWVSMENSLLRSC
jgi:hypothetical protein